MDNVARWPIGQHVPLAMAIHELRQTARAAHGEHPLRLVHFLAVAYLTASVVRAAHPLLRSAWAKPLLLTGQFSLQSFCLGAVMSVLAMLYWAAYAPGPLAQLLATLLGCSLMALLAAALAAMRREARGDQLAAAANRLAPDLAAAQHLGRHGPQKVGAGSL
jgi:hypothetical protein